MSATVAKILLGLDAENMTASIESKEYCRVTLYNGGHFPNGDPYYVTYPLESNQESYYESGDLVRPRSQDTGEDLVMDCAWLDSGTQGEAIGLQGKKIAKTIYNRIVGKQYKPFISNNAILNPLAEIGDGVLVNGHYAPIYRRVAYLDPLYTADIAAPYKEEEDEEYPYEDKSSTEFDRVKKSIFGTRSSLTVTNENINLLVERLYGEEDGDITTLSSEIDVQAGKIGIVVSEKQGGGYEVNRASIIASINQDEGSTVAISANKVFIEGATTFTTIKQYTDNSKSEAISAANSNTNTVVTNRIAAVNTSLENGTTTINGACITTGTIDAHDVSVTNAFQILGPKGQGVDGTYGYMGPAYGAIYDPDTSQTITTYGVAIAAEDSESTGQGTRTIDTTTLEPYVIVTTEGARMSCNGNGIVVTNSGVYYKKSNGSWTSMGVAVFG